MSSHDTQKVYVIQHELGPVKIGIAEEPRKRLSEIQVSCPFELHIKKTRAPRNARRVERLLHDVFNQYHMRGEWFDIPVEYRDFPIPERVTVAGAPSQVIKLPEERDMNKEWAHFFEKCILALGTKYSTSEIESLREIWREWGDIPDPKGEERDPTVKTPDLKELAEDTPTGMKRCSRCGHHFDQNEMVCPHCSSDSSPLNDVW